MNIFVTYASPQLSARALDDKRVNKMILESTQIMATSFLTIGLKKFVPLTKIGAPFKSTHVSHPCIKWATESSANMQWLLFHLKALSDEYTKRFNRIHHCSTQFNRLGTGSMVHSSFSKNTKLTPFVNCSAHKSLDVFAGYRLTMIGKWRSSSPKWTKTIGPEWFTDAAAN